MFAAVATVLGEQEFLLALELGIIFVFDGDVVVILAYGAGHAE